MSNSLSHALPYPIKGARFTLPLSFRVAAGTPTDPTTPDTEISTDGGASFTDAAEEITTGGANGAGYLTLTGAETNNSVLHVAGKSANCLLTPATLFPRVLAQVGTGTLSAGSAGGGTLGTLLAYDVTGCFIKTTGGTGGGGTGGANNQARKIVTYDTTTGAFTVEPNWETTPDATTTYAVLLPEGVTLGMLRALNPVTAGAKAAIDGSGQVTVGTNNDKAGYTASTVSDKTGYALTSAYDPAKTAAQAGDAMTLSGDLTPTMKTSVTTAATAATPNAASVTGAVGSVTNPVTVGTNNDKTGYALTSGYDPAKTAAQAGDAMALTTSERASTATAVWASGTRTLSSFGTLAADAAAAVWAYGTRVLTAGTNIVLAKGTGVTGFNDIAAGAAMTLTSGERTAIANEVEAQIIDETDSEKVLTAITDKIAAVNPDLGGLTVAAIASAVGTQITSDHGSGLYTRNTEPPTAASVADAVWDEARADHVTAGSFGQGAASVQGNVTGSVASVTAPVTLTSPYDAAKTAAQAGDAMSLTGDLTPTMKTSVTTAATAATPNAASVTGAVGSVTSPVTVGTNNDKTGYALTSSYDPAKTASQAGDAMALTTSERSSVATSVWASGTRTLSSYGTLVADVAAAVWAYATRILTAATNITSTGGTTVPQTGDAYAAATSAATAANTAATSAGTAATAATTAATAAAASKLVTDKLDTALQLDGSVYRFTANALEQAPSGGGGGSGDGSILIDHDYGGAGSLSYKTSTGAGIDNAIVKAFLLADYEAGLTGSSDVRGQTTTNASGEWESPLALDAGDYVLIYFKQGVYGPDRRDVTVAA